jgi:hypothetical protein
MRIPVKTNSDSGPNRITIVIRIAAECLFDLDRKTQFEYKERYFTKCVNPERKTTSTIYGVRMVNIKSMMESEAG